MKKRILFITPELPYTGAPRSMLRMCKVAAELGYEVTVWSAEPGPFEAEYHRFGFEVRIVPYRQASSKGIIAEIRKHDLAVCNTIVTYKFAQICSRYIPVVWYIREATNIPAFAKNNPNMMYALQNSLDIYCVSEYAQKAIAVYTKHRIRVIRNCVEDVTKDEYKYSPGTADKVRFIQLGTIEYRKGYDVLLDAFNNMQTGYIDKAELYFAGRTIAGEKEFGEKIIREAENMDSVFYLGELRGEDAIKRLSEMDVVIVASRDESCSLVALEGAMMSKPLILTENVGANYIVKENNGIIAKTGDSDSLRIAMERMISEKAHLKKMGERSRSNYEEMASMDIYRREMENLFERTEEKHTFLFQLKRLRNLFFTSYKIQRLRQRLENMIRL